MTLNSPVKPTLLWDGECAFCEHWIQRWRKGIGEAIDCRSYQEALPEFPQVSAAECAKAVQLILPDGRVYSAAYAVLKSLALGRGSGRLLACYEKSKLFRRFAEVAYRFIAANRSWLPQV